ERCQPKPPRLVLEEHPAHAEFAGQFRRLDQLRRLVARQAGVKQRGALARRLAPPVPRRRTAVPVARLRQRITHRTSIPYQPGNGPYPENRVVIYGPVVTTAWCRTKAGR